MGRRAEGGVIAVEDAGIILLFFLVALLYSSVGHAGASGYLAVLTLVVGLTGDEVQKIGKPTALALNILVGTIGTLQFASAQQIPWRQLLPFCVGSVPLAFYGDRFGALVRNDSHWSVAEQLAGRQRPTQFGQILEELGIAFITLHPPLVLFGLFVIYGMSGYAVYVWKRMKGRPVCVIATSMDEPDEQGLHR